MIFHGDFWFFHVQNSTVISRIFKKFGVQNGVLEGVRVPIFLDFTGFFEVLYISCRGTKNDLYHAFYLFTNLYISIFYYAQIFKGENS